MKTLDAVSSNYFQKLDIKPPTEREIKNLTNLINHWIQDENCGRAHFGHIAKDETVDLEFIGNNLPAARELAKIRKVCTNCEVQKFSDCPYNEKRIRGSRNYENEKGLKKGTVNVNKISERPTIIRRRNKFYFAFELCPLES